MMYRNKKLREFARGRSCTVRGPNCDGGGETSVWAHSDESRHGKATGLKGHDIFGCIACYPCHMWLHSGIPREERERVFREAWEASLIAACNEGGL